MDLSRDVKVIFDVLLALGVIAALTGYTFAQIKRGSRDYTREENKDLKERVDTLEKSVTALSDQVKRLTYQKNDFENLILTALENFFSNNPGAAMEIKKKLDSSNIQ